MRQNDLEENYENQNPICKVLPVSRAAESKQSIIRGQHGPVEIDNIRVLVVSQNVVKGNVLDNMRVCENQFDVLRAIHRGTVPEKE